MMSTYLGFKRLESSRKRSFAYSSLHMHVISATCRYNSPHIYLPLSKSCIKKLIYNGPSLQLCASIKYRFNHRGSPILSQRACCSCPVHRSQLRFPFLICCRNTVNTRKSFFPPQSEFLSGILSFHSSTLPLSGMNYTSFE
jgi:hypothetical protein